MSSQSQTTSNNNSSPSRKARASNRSRDWWREQFDQWRASGLSKADFCKAQGLKASSFYNWACQFQNGSKQPSQPKQSPSRFIKAVVGPDPVPLNGIAITVQDVTLRFDQGVSPESLGDWVKALRSSVC